MTFGKDAGHAHRRRHVRIRRINDAERRFAARHILQRHAHKGIAWRRRSIAYHLRHVIKHIILHVLGDSPLSVNCQGNANVTNGIEDVTNMSMTFRNKRFATIQSSWLEPRKIREMTIVGTRRMILYDDVQTLEKIRIYDVRVDRPPHYDTFADFHYSYHYGDSYIPKLAQEEPLKTECQHFLDSIEAKTQPLTGGRAGLEMVRILEASSQSLRQNGAPVFLAPTQEGQNGVAAKQNAECV